LDLLISIGQIILYLISDTLKIKFGRLFLFLALLVSYFFIIPPYFYPEPDPNEANCGTPIVAITFGFWILGGGLASVVNITYFLLKKQFDSTLN
jgi:hypothetical protein